jgi:transposase
MGLPRVYDRRIVSGIIFAIRNGLRWRDAPAAYGSPKTIYNRFIRWSRMGGRVQQDLRGPSDQGGKPDQLMIDATHLKAHRAGARRIHTCYERCAHAFMSAICIAATIIFWINQ